MRALSQGVHTGIRAAGAGQVRGLPCGPGQRCFQHLLHRQAVVLALPAGIARAVIFDGEQDAFQASHPGSRIIRYSASMLSRAKASRRLYFS